MKVTRHDRIFFRLIASAGATLILGSVAALSLLSFNISTPTAVIGLMTILLGMVLFNERLSVSLLIRGGFLCPRCRGKSLTADFPYIMRGEGCRCGALARDPKATLSS